MLSPVFSARVNKGRASVHCIQKAARQGAAQKIAPAKINMDVLRKLLIRRLCAALFPIPSSGLELCKPQPITG
jgi:hypothetical protein